LIPAGYFRMEIEQLINYFLFYLDQWKFFLFFWGKINFLLINIFPGTAHVLFSWMKFWCIMKHPFILKFHSILKWVWADDMQEEERVLPYLGENLMLL
jgi:hypothetical protein